MIDQRVQDLHKTVELTTANQVRILKQTVTPSDYPRISEACFLSLFFPRSSRHLYLRSSFVAHSQYGLVHKDLISTLTTNMLYLRESELEMY